MNLVAQFNFFWQKHPEHAFKPLEIAVYAYLLHFCNGLGRKNPFNLAKERLMFEMGLRTEDAIDTARKRLREAGLIQFENGYGRGRTTLYTLLSPPTTLLKSAAIEAVEKGGEKGVKNIPFSEEETVIEGPVKGRQKGGKKQPLLEGAESEKGGEKGVKNTPDKGGTTLKKRKEKGICANAENEAAQKPLDFELFWEAYAKKRDRHKSSQRWATLNPDEQAAALDRVPDYVAATPDKQYRKDPLTYLNGKCWLDEDLPTCRTGNQKPAPTAAPAAPIEAPAPNPEFIAQQQAREDAARADLLARRTATA